MNWYTLIVGIIGLVSIALTIFFPYKVKPEINPKERLDLSHKHQFNLEKNESLESPLFINENEESTAPQSIGRKLE